MNQGERKSDDRQGLDQAMVERVSFAIKGVTTAQEELLYKWRIQCHARKSTGLPWLLSGKESAFQRRRLGFDPYVGKIPWRRNWQHTPVFLPGKSHDQRSLVGFSPWDCKESDTTEQVSPHTDINSVCMSTPVIQFIPVCPFPLDIYTFVLYICVSISAL